uniref:Putative secreted protein n=1 Tax=Ixodes ricinus TaxID=34613 RepID=A0A090X9B0_IXORI
MKIQAFPIIAVLAALLSIVSDTPAGNEPNQREDQPVVEDRSCKKREKEAKNALKNGKTVESCNYFCKPNNDIDNYDEKMYPVGTKCKYGPDKVSKCTEKGCPYPTDSEDDSKGEEKTGEGSNDGGENVGETGEGEEVGTTGGR